MRKELRFGVNRLNEAFDLIFSDGFKTNGLLEEFLVKGLYLDHADWFTIFKVGNYYALEVEFIPRIVRMNSFYIFAVNYPQVINFLNLGL